MALGQGANIFKLCLNIFNATTNSYDIATIHFSEHFIADGNHVRDFIRINADEDEAISCQQIFCKQQSRINHGTPVGVEATVALRIGDELATFVVVIAALGFGGGDGFAEIVFVDEIVSRVVWRIAQVGTMDTTAWGGIRETYG